MKNVTLSMLAGLIVASTAATAAQAEVMRGPSDGGFGQRVSENARGFTANYDQGRPYSLGHRAPHAGFDPNGDGVHPAIGPITDQ